MRYLAKTGKAKTSKAFGKSSKAKGCKAYGGKGGKSGGGSSKGGKGSKGCSKGAKLRRLADVVPGRTLHRVSGRDLRNGWRAKNENAES